MQNGGRPALNTAGSFIASAVLIVLFVFAALRVAGAQISVRWIARILTGDLGYSRTHPETVLTVIFQRLPATLELIIGSFVIAAFAGWAIAALSKRAPQSIRPIIANIALPLQCIPFFVVALAASFFIVFHFRSVGSLGIAGLGHFDFRDRLMHLIGPACALALIQISPITDRLSNRSAAQQGPPHFGSMLTSLSLAFADRLPEVLSATILIEIFFAWPGEGRLFFGFGWFEGVGPRAIALALLGSLAVLAVRALAKTLATREAKFVTRHDV